MPGTAVLRCGSVPIPEQLLRDPAITGPLGSLAISHVRPQSSALALRAIRWHAGLERLGVVLPFAVVHDVGLLFAAPREQVEIGPRVDPAAVVRGLAEAPALFATYRGVLEEIAESEAARKGPELKMSDDLIVVVLSRLLGTVASRLNVPPAYRSAIPVDATLFERLEPQLVALFGMARRSFEAAALQGIGIARLFVLTMSDALDLDTLRLFGMLGSEASAGAMAQVDLLAALESPEANDIVNFSLEIIPSVLETKRATGIQTFAVDGYAGLMRSGHLDQLLLSELAYPDDLFEQRYLENELFYYAREREQGEERRLHYIVIDASASMRGVRQVFARGLALTLIKKLTLRGEEIVVRFFDSRLHDVVRVRGGAVNVPYLLCFKSEMGRNYRRVFQQLALDLQRTLRSQRRGAVLYLLTHAECHIPIEVVQRLRKIAFLYGVFILPSSGEVELDYVDLLGRVQIVDKGTLDVRAKRAERALEIVDDAVRVSTPPAARRRPADER